jgi:hypothetical protein
MFFLRVENIMPAYSAYRILIEVVLEALPQVEGPPGVLQYLQRGALCRAVSSLLL